MNRRRVAAAVVSAILIGGGIWWLVHLLRAPSDDNVLILYGNVDIREVRPAFNNTGPITAMKVLEGAAVKQGELLATIDDTRYAANLAQAQREADNRKAVLEKLVNGSRPEEIAQAKATMDGLRATSENNRILYERTVKLLARGSVSTEDRDNALARFNSSRESYTAARQAYLLAVRGPRAEDIAAARAAFEAAEAAVALAHRQFADTKLYAPADGIVENRILEPGDMAAPSTPVYTIALTDPLWVRTYVPESKVGRVRLGMPATVSTDSYPGHVYRGWIGYLSPLSEFTPKSVETPELRTALVYQLRVYVCDARGELRLGMPATVRIELDRNAGTTTPECGPDHAAPR